MVKFLKRTVISLLLIGIVSVVIYKFPGWLFSGVVAGFVAFSLYEFFCMVENKGIFVYKYFGTIVGSFVPVVIFMGQNFSEVKNLEPILIIAASLFVLISQFLRKDNARDHLVSMGVTLFALFYISWFFSFFVKIRLIENGANLVAFLIITTKGADIGAYVGGSKFGRTELIPRISPNKTVEGTISGVLLSLAFALLLGSRLTGLSTLHVAILAVILAILGQVGDLAESLIKRDCNVKDSGPVLAEIGGVFDLIDSLLFTAPFFYFYIKMIY